jgi:hypothetical protein
VQPGSEALLFPSVKDPDATLHHQTLYKQWEHARVAAGRPDLRIHDLRHGAAVMAAQSGATLAELMQRLGHSTSRAAMRYQHAALGRDAEIAIALSEMARRSEVPRPEERILPNTSNTQQPIFVATWRIWAACLMGAIDGEALNGTDRALPLAA